MNNKLIPSPFPAHTWIGLIIVFGGQLLFHLGVRFFAVWLTPIMWTGYILAVDGFVYRLSGRSWLTTRKFEFPLLLFASIGVWLVFEVYNFHLRNWYYLGVPEAPWIRNLAFLWSFATIMPGVFETIDFLAALLHRSLLPQSKRGPSLPTGSAALWLVLGIGMVAIPPLLPSSISAFLFGPIWIGYILLFDPINQRLGLPSIRLNLQGGRWRYVAVILAAGLVCGFLWETWNFQAFLSNGGHWIYTVPDSLRPFGWRFGQMPLLGLLGFPPFALELVLIYSFIRAIFNIEKWYPQVTGNEHPLLPRKFVENQ